MRELFNGTGAGSNTAKGSQGVTVAATDLAALAQGNTAFALELYGQLRCTPGNLIFSPYSLSSALALTHAGARGETARQIQQTLHFPEDGANLHGLFWCLDELLRAAQADGDIELAIANALWPQKRYEFRQEFLDLLRTHYQAVLTPVDYEQDAEKARATINGWVKDKTRGHITDLIGPGVLDALTRLVLVNAIYFKGRWQTPFDELFTRPDKFYLDSERAVAVPFMHQEERFLYGENAQVQILRMPYAKNQFEMQLLLPRGHDGLPQLENSLTQPSLAAWTAQAQIQEVRVAVPKFTLSTVCALKHALRALGVSDAFDPDRADFSGTDGLPHWLYLSAAVHQAFLEVNEQGTEAAAATAVASEYWAVTKKPTPPEFRADHPFLFLLRESTTGSILFMGRVAVQCPT